MRFIIHGAGAIGSVIGGKLAESGTEVILIARQAHVDAIARDGLLIKSHAGERRIRNLRAVTTPAQIAPLIGDVILLTVKSGQTGDSVQQLRETFPEDTPVVCLQNGVRNEETAARRFLRVYGAMVGVCAASLAPGVVAHTRASLLSLGNYPLGCDEDGHEIAARLRGAGFRVTTHDHIMAVKWSKLLLNLNNATYAILDKHLQLGLVMPELSRFTADVLEEGLHVLDMAGISLTDPENPYDLSQQLAELRSVAENPEKIYQAETTPPEMRTYPSTWTDLKQHRGETEASFFNGEIILLGEKYGVPTPLNSTLLNIIETMAAERIEPGLYSLDELTDLVEQRRLKIYDGEGVS